MTDTRKIVALHLTVLAVLFAAQFVLSAYHSNNVARIMVLAVFAMGYNISYGYTGLLSLGHALFFATGLYATGLAVWLLEWPSWAALSLGIVAGGVMAAAVGLLALRTKGVSFMIVTLMFAQAGYLLILYFGKYTGGDEGFAVELAGRSLFGTSFGQDRPRFFAAFALFALAMVGNLALVRSHLGRVMVAVRENEDRTQMLGYSPFQTRLIALVISGVYSGAAGAMYAQLFGYVGASFATVEYSILPMLYVLLGGVGTVLGPLIGAGVMFYVIDIASGLTSAYLMLVGIILVLLVLFAPRGILGTLRERWLKWLP
ncbi:MAG: branched-chain amino acid ABC transporter permease [Microgenomates group bacterium]